VRNFRRSLMLGISLLVLILMSLFVVVPYLLVGPPTPIFSVRNHDAGVHELRVEIFNSKNNSVFDEIYELSAGEEIYRAKPFRFLFPGFEGEDYTFKFTLDNSLKEIYSTNIRPGTLLMWNSTPIMLKASLSL